MPEAKAPKPHFGTHARPVLSDLGNKEAGQGQPRRFSSAIRFARIEVPVNFSPLNLILNLVSLMRRP
jgi:hypothetical protein